MDLLNNKLLLLLQNKGRSAVYWLQDGGEGIVIGGSDISVTRVGVVVRRNCGKAAKVRGG
jgi:hypothetical protein